MHNIRPYLTKLANQIISDHTSTGRGLSSLVAEKTAQEGLNDEAARHLVGITNKEFVKQHSEIPEFDIADYRDVIKEISGSKTATQKVASMSEYKPNTSYLKSHTGYSNPERSQKTANVTDLCNSFLNRELDERSSKYANIYSQLEKSHLNVHENVAQLKKAGFSLTEIYDMVSDYCNLGQKTSSAIGTIYNQANDNVSRDPYMKSMIDSEALASNVAEHVNTLVKSASLLNQAKESYNATVKSRHYVHRAGVIKA